MPTSAACVIGPMIYRIKAIDPMSVLDVGAGCGKWGFLLREYLDAHHELTTGRPRHTRIDAVEIFPRWIGPARPFYDHVYECDVRECPVPLAEYDCVLFGDVVEHMTREEGRKLLDACRHYVVSTPKGMLEQGPVGGNENERHVSAWEPEDFAHADVMLCPTQTRGPIQLIVGWK